MSGVLCYTSQVEGGVLLSPPLSTNTELTGQVGPSRMVDVSQLREVKMKKSPTTGWVGSWYYNADTGKPEYKTCSMCRKIKPCSGYNKSSKNKHGLYSQCKECLRASSSLLYSKYKESDPMYNKKRNNTQIERYLSRTQEEIQLSAEELRPDGAKICLVCLKSMNLDLFHRSNRSPDGRQYECIKCSTRRRGERRVGAYREYWLSLDIPLNCYIAGCEVEYSHADHVIPLKLFGPDILENILPLCEHHNTSKQGRSLLTWLTETHPDVLEDTLQAVLSYGVSPWSYQESAEDIEKWAIKLSS